MEAIKQWLDNEPRDFDAGLAIFALVTRNRNITNWITRKRDMAKLVYEMGKLAGTPTLATPTVDDIPPLVKPETLRKERGLNLKTSPAPIRELFRSAVDAYKKATYTHAEMAAATTDQVRAEKRAALMDLQKVYGHCWDKIDGWIANGQIPVDTTDADTALTTALNTLNITKNEEKRAALIVKIRSLTAQLQEAGVKFTEKRAERLRTLEIIK